MKYKVGNEVKIKSLDWYNKNKDKDDNRVSIDDIDFVQPMKIHCSKYATITRVIDDNEYLLDIDCGDWTWTEEMFEENTEEKDTKPTERLFSLQEVVEIVREVGCSFHLNSMNDADIEKVVSKWIDDNMSKR